MIHSAALAASVNAGLRDRFEGGIMRQVCLGALLRRLVNAVLVGCTIGVASAQTWPAKPIKVVIPFPAGGSTDILARILTEKLAAELGQTLVVDNRGGAAGTIGADFVAKSPPDGYTILFASPPDQVTTIFLRQRLPYDPAKDFAPVVLLMRGSNVLTTRPSLPVANVQELVALARAKPGTLTFSSAGVGNTSHLSGELFKVEAKIDILHVPHKGNAEAATAVLGGHIDMLFQSPIAAAKQIAAGKLKPLAVTADQRVAALPNVPTFAEAGFPGIVVAPFYCFVVAAQTPAEIVSRLNVATNKVLQMRDVREKLSEFGFDIAGGSPEQLRNFLGVERERWGRVIREARIKPE